MARVYLARIANPDMTDIKRITPIRLALVRRSPTQTTVLSSENGSPLLMHTSAFIDRKSPSAAICRLDALFALLE